MPLALVVDDSLILRRQVCTVLGPWVAVEAVDGVQALEQLDQHPEIKLVVCDVSMPRMGGMEFLETLRLRGNKVDVVMLTTEAQPALVARARELGARGWLTKPMQKELLLSLARHVLGAAPAAQVTP